MMHSISSLLFISLALLTANFAAAKPQDPRDYETWSIDNEPKKLPFKNEPQLYQCTDYVSNFNAKKWTRSDAKWCTRKDTQDIILFNAASYWHSYGFISTWCASPNFPAQLNATLSLNGEVVATVANNQKTCWVWLKVDVLKPLPSGSVEFDADIHMDGPFYKKEKKRYLNGHNKVTLNLA